MLSLNALQNVIFKCDILNTENNGPSYEANDLFRMSYTLSVEKNIICSFSINVKA